MDKIDRYKGCMLGLATGDALGTTLEFMEPGSFNPIDEIVGGGAFNLQPGQWTDDTAMSLCLAKSLTAKQAFDPVDQLERYARWYTEGYMSSTGMCIGLGRTTHIALEKFLDTHQAYCGPVQFDTAGNGSIMRLAAVPLFFADDVAMATQMSGVSSKTTHGNPLAVDACRYFGSIISGIVQGKSKEEVLSDKYEPAPNYWNANPLVSEIETIRQGSFKRLEPPQIEGSGFVIKSLEAALWAFYKSTTFRDGCMMAVNLGDDADTTGAVYGQMAGAYYGINGIPDTWLSKIARRDLIESLAEDLFKLCTSRASN